MTGFSGFPLSRDSKGFSVVGLFAVLVALGVVGFVGWQIYQSQRSTDALEGSGQLVGLPAPKDDKPKTDKPASPDGLPSGFVAYTDAKLGFSFAYPEAWGSLQPVADPATVLNLSTGKVEGYSLADALQVSATKTSSFRIRANDNEVIVMPVPSGGGYEWRVTDRGKDRRAIVNRPLSPAPPVVYRSGKAQVYNFLASNGACTYNMWAFAVQDNFVKLRLPSFCVSPKPGDAEVQVQHKADFDKVKSQILQSITVL